jgi:DNA repair photolyase
LTVCDGCSHGCQFCYVKSLPSIWGDPGDKFANAGIDAPDDEWGDYVLYRDDVVQNTADDCQRLLPDQWRTTKRGQGIVGISFTTDCYMDRRAGDLTKGVVRTLVGHDRTARILTRNPKLLADLHGEFYEALPTGSVTVGSSIPTLDAAEARAIEPDAPAIEHRLQGLESLRNVPRFVSMSPTYPTQSYADLRDLLAELKTRIRPSVVFHEPINPRSGNIEACIQQAREQGQHDLARELERIRDPAEWTLYALRQLRDVQKAAKQVGQRVHLWPDERLAEDAPTEAQREWCKAWRKRPSPEQIGDGPACDEPYPESPEVANHEQGRLDSYQ